MEANDKASRRDFVRRLERKKHAEDLARLPELTYPERLSGILREYQISAES